MIADLNPTAPDPRATRALRFESVTNWQRLVNHGGLSGADLYRGTDGFGSTWCLKQHHPRDSDLLGYVELLPRLRSDGLDFIPEFRGPVRIDRSVWSATRWAVGQPLSDADVIPADWAATGMAIARFHEAGLRHPPRAVREKPGDDRRSRAWADWMRSKADWGHFIAQHRNRDTDLLFGLVRSLTAGERRLGALLQRRSRSFDQPTWIHGDLRPPHIYLRDGRVVGMIDFDQMRWDDPVEDLARLGCGLALSTVHRESLRAGYASVRAAPDPRRWSDFEWSANWVAGVIWSARLARENGPSELPSAIRERIQAIQRNLIDNLG